MASKILLLNIPKKHMLWIDSLLGAACHGKSAMRRSGGMASILASSGNLVLSKRHESKSNTNFYKCSEENYYNFCVFSGN